VKRGQLRRTIGSGDDQLIAIGRELRPDLQARLEQLIADQRWAEVSRVLTRIRTAGLEARR